MNHRCLKIGLLLLERGEDYAPEDPYPFRICPVKTALSFVDGKILETIGFADKKEIEIWLTKFEEECKIKNEKHRLKLTGSLIGPVKRGCTEAKFEAPEEPEKRSCEDERDTECRAGEVDAV